jgi:pimeloyl-ACP methyl ester carboxylesterase
MMSAAGSKYRSDNVPVPGRSGRRRHLLAYAAIGLLYIGTVQGGGMTERDADRFRERWFQTSDGLSVFYRDYAQAAEGTPVVCLHGLTRNSADFEDLAPHLAQQRRVLAMDVRGRGRSERDPNWGNYRPDVYVQDVWNMLDDAAIEHVVVIGTSMGGLMGMMMGALRPERVAGLILNDIGPDIDPVGLERISGYVGVVTPVASWDEARETLRRNNEIALPGLSESDWDRMARRWYREDEHGRLAPNYDPAIARAMNETGAAPADMWTLFDALPGTPILVLRGEHSDILHPDTLAEMKRRHPDLEYVVVPDRGHVPFLDEPVALTAIERFLARIDDAR